MRKAQRRSDFLFFLRKEQSRAKVEKPSRKREHSDRAAESVVLLKELLIRVD